MDRGVEEAAFAEYSNHSTDIHIHVEEEKIGIERNAEEKEGQADPSGVYFAEIAAEEVATCVLRVEATVMAVDVDEKPSHIEVGNA